MRTDLFDYDLPAELIAQNPLPRGQSRLLVVHRSTGQIEHREFSGILDYLRESDLLVVNDTRVTARRLEARRANGLKAEILLITPVGERSWRVLVRPGRPLRSGSKATIIGPDSEVCCTIIDELPDGGRTIDLPDSAWRDRIASWGYTPVPPYIHHQLEKAEEERYQTVYGRRGGSSAAPTAGLHFTEELLGRIKSVGVATTAVTLHIGVGTFRPVRTVDISDHTMHSELVTVTAETANAINKSRGRIIAVGTTTVRALESAVNSVINPQGDVLIDGHKLSARSRPFHGETNLFIQPGYQFRTVDALVTNFHQPKSTLLMMVSAFAGVDLIKTAYREAIERRYRFLSFGDAMLII